MKARSYDCAIGCVFDMSNACPWLAAIFVVSPQILILNLRRQDMRCCCKFAELASCIHWLGFDGFVDRWVLRVAFLLSSNPCRNHVQSLRFCKAIV